MFCTNCGAAIGPEDQFCISCGQKLKGEALVTGELQARTSPQPPKPVIRWIIASAAVLILAGGAGYWFLKGPGGQEQSLQASANNSAVQQTVQAPSASPESVSDSAAATEPAIATEATAPPQTPVYIQVNQVDSVNYEQGKVDVYFSLFSDQDYETELTSTQLTKDMFRINQLAVDSVSRVENVDNVSVNLVLDKSGSMSDPPSGSVIDSKMDLVRQAAVEFVRNAPAAARGQFEVLSFSTYAPSAPDISFTSDLNSVSSYLESLQSDGGATALYDSLTKALYDTNYQDGPKYIIAFTDGQDSNYGSSVQSVIDLSRQLGIPIFCIGFGTMDNDLQIISQETGGQYFAISIDDNLQEELEQIYSKVFQRYVKQYKLTFAPQQKILPGEDFTLSLDLESADFKGQTPELTFTRKVDAASINVLNGLFEYQVNYASAVNQLDFSLVSNNVKADSPFYSSLQKRIEIDYVNADAQGKKKIIDPLKNYNVESVLSQPDGSYKIVFFKFFPLLLNNENVFEADLNTYTLVKDSSTDKWQISEFGRKECSIYRDPSDPGSLCTENAVDTLYSGNPWPKN